MTQYKQVLVMRTDLGMRRGKEIAQGAHASLAVVLANREHPYVVGWLSGQFTKVALGVGSLEELVGLVAHADVLGIPTMVIEDAGRTEFHGERTVTCAAIGPGPVELIDSVTGHLKLR